jgi:peptide-methionine (S)-S-oxide reductase
MGQYYKDNIVTEISPYKIFYEADLEHQDYYKNNKGNRYCDIVIEPKLAKLRQLFRK